MALAKVNLSKITRNRNNKITLLKDAVSSIETCIKLTKITLEKSQLEWVYSRYAEFYYSFGGTYYQSYLLTKEKNLLCKAIEVYEGALVLFVRLKLMTRVAESNWQKAKIQDQLGEHLEAAKDYELASEAYLKAAVKIPQLKEFYKNHSLYMLAWSQIEQARYKHAREDYAQAMEHYKEAASLHEKLTTWSYLAPNYYAWVQLEKGEDLSRKEESPKAIQSFQLATDYFKKAQDSINTKIETLEATEEKEVAANLVRASDLRSRYCQARISLEEAKIFDRRGEYNLSSKSYGKTAEDLGKIIDELESEEEQRELRLIMVLSQAWEKMALAEEQASPKFYYEASGLFEQGKTYSPTKKTTLLLLGNSSYCKGLAAQTKFQSNLKRSFYSMANKHMNQASKYYEEAGFQTASEYAKATQRLFDAYLYMHNAEGEVDPEKKTKYYHVAEQLLQIAAGSFMKAKQPEKTSQVQRILATVREEKALVVSLTKVMQAPSIASSTLSFGAPSPTSEVSVGLEQFEHANIQANLIADNKEVKVRESFILTVELVNVGKQAALLTKVEDFVPSDFIVVKKPEIYRLEESCLNMKGKQITPLKLVEAKVVLQPLKMGVYQLKPRVLYLDERGQNRTLQLKTLEIVVEEVVLANRVSTGTKELDSLLLGGIPEGYAMVLTGSPSDERELLIRNFLENGINQDQTTFYIATKATGLDNLLENSSFYLFLCNPKPKVKVPDLPNITKIRAKTDINNLNMALTRAIRNVEQKQPTKRVCLEIVSDVLLRHGPEVTRRWISELITDLGTKGFKIMAVIDPSMHPPDQANAVINLFDGEINITQTEDPLECKKSIQIKKLRNQDYIKNPICLT